MLVSLDSPEFSSTFPGLAPRVNLGPNTMFPVYVVYRGNYQGVWQDYKTSVDLIRKRLPANLTHCQTFCFGWSLTEVYYTLTYEQSFGEIVRLYGNTELQKVLIHHFGMWEHVIIGRTLREKISDHPNPLPLAPNEMAPMQPGPTSPVTNVAPPSQETLTSQRTPPSSQRTLPLSQRAQQSLQTSMSPNSAMSPPASPFTHSSGFSFIGSPLRSAPSPTPSSGSASTAGSPNKRPLSALFTRTQPLISRTQGNANHGRWGSSLPTLGGPDMAKIIEYAISTHVAEAMAVVYNSGRRFGPQYETELIDALVPQLALRWSELEKPELEGAAEEVEETIHGDGDDHSGGEGNSDLYDAGGMEFGRAGPGPSTRARRNY
ncbi:hypothetical protein FRC11_006781 [Ceratobasidium sp. 423]|nr:hypothetical protein FRC11_006781 [Ceratobasidium sp. 423]